MSTNTENGSQAEESAAPVDRRCSAAVIDWADPDKCSFSARSVVFAARIAPDVILMTKDVLRELRVHCHDNAKPIEVESFYGIPFESFWTEEAMEIRADELRKLGKHVATFAT